MASLRTYYNLTKPGIIYGNILTIVAGFLLAAKGHIHPVLFICAVLGSALVIASGCVFNNVIDRNIDAKMARTKKRALVSGKISAHNALIYATVLGLAGIAILFFFVNLLTLAVGLLGLLFYVVFYGVAKRRSVHGTLVGSVSGAVPPLAGYCAASNHLDLGGVLLFLILAVWQMPHFYAIAVYRLDDYRAAKLPVLPAVQGIAKTKVQILAYIIAFIAASFSLTVFGYTSYLYLAVMAAAGVYWLRLAILGFEAKDDKRWARQVFGASLKVLLVFCLLLATNSLIHP